MLDSITSTGRRPASPGSLAPGLAAAIVILAVVVVVNELLPTGSKLFFTSRPPSCDAANAASPEATQTLSPLAFTSLPEGKNVAECTFGSQRWRYTVVSVGRQKSVQWHDYRPSEEAKGIWVIARVRVENLSRFTASLSPEDLAIQDGGQNYYRADSSMSYAYSNHNRLADPLGSYPPGVAAVAAFLFDVKPDAGGLKLFPARCRSATVSLGK